MPSISKEFKIKKISFTEIDFVVRKSNSWIIMPMLKIISGLKTDEEVYAASFDIIKVLGIMAAV